MGRFIKTAFGALLAVNVAMFVIFHVVVACCGAEAARWFALTGPDPAPWLWTPLTYMFTQDSPMELLFNLLWLYLFNSVFMESGTDRQMLTAYLCGGLMGAAAFLAASAAGAGGGLLLGSSAAALAVVVCAAVRTPRMRLCLMFFGAVEFRWIAAIAVGLSMLAFASGNPGGGFAHVGGALGGICAALYIRRKSRFRIVRPRAAASREKTLDELLDKVKRSGYASLNADERRQLLDYSKRL